MSSKQNLWFFVFKIMVIFPNIYPLLLVVNANSFSHYLLLGSSLP